MLEPSLIDCDTIAKNEMWRPLTLLTALEVHFRLCNLLSSLDYIVYSVSFAFSMKFGKSHLRRLPLRIWYDGVTYYVAERPPAASEDAIETIQRPQISTQRPQLPMQTYFLGF